MSKSLGPKKGRFGLENQGKSAENPEILGTKKLGFPVKMFPFKTNPLTFFQGHHGTYLQVWVECPCW
jgi:hypothetical protein